MTPASDLPRPFFRSLTALFTLLALGLAVAAVPAAAQDDVPAYYQIQYVQVKPEHLAEYQQAVTELVALYEKHDYKYAMQARSYVNEMVIRYIQPMDSLADLEAMDREFERFQKAAGSAYQKIAERFQKASISSRTAVFRTRLDLSYQPDNPDPADGEGNFQQLGFWHIQRDKVDEAEANAKAYAELFRKKGIRRPFLILQSYIGDDPLYLVVESGKSAADFYAKAEAINQKLGAEGQQMNLRALAAARDFVARDSENLPALSYTP